MTKTEAQLVSLKEAVVDSNATIRSLIDDVERLSSEHKELIKGLDRHREFVEKEMKEVKSTMNDLSAESRVGKQRLDDHQRQFDKWDARFWGLVILLLGGFITLYFKK